MRLALVCARILLAGVFLVAAVGKLLNWKKSVQAIAAFGVPVAFVRPVGAALPMAELLVAALLVPVRSAWWGATGALTLLLVFLMGIAVNLARGRTPDCQCFGQIGSHPIGVRTLVRNGVLALVAAAILTNQDAVGSVRDLAVTAASLVSGHVFLAAVASGTVALLVAEAYVLSHLLRQHGRLLLRMDRLERQLTSNEGTVTGMPVLPFRGLAVGAPAPNFEVSTPSGSKLGLGMLLRGYRGLVLIFTDPGCHACRSLWLDIRRWQSNSGSGIRIAVISPRSSEARDRRSVEHPDVLLQNDGDVSELYAVPGTPGAVLIRDDGRIGSPVAMGVAAITTLIEGLIEVQAASPA